MCLPLLDACGAHYKLQYIRPYVVTLELLLRSRTQTIQAGNNASLAWASHSQPQQHSGADSYNCEVLRKYEVLKKIQRKKTK